MDSEPESQLVSLISQLIFLDDSDSGYSSDVMSLIFQIIALLNSVDLDSQPKPESELMSLTTRSIYLFNSMDLDSQPKPLRKLISFISQRFSLVNSIDSDLEPDQDQVFQFMPLIDQTLKLKPEPELMSLIHRIFSLVISMNSKSRKLISVCPQVKVKFEKGRFHVIDVISWRSNNKWHCLPSSWDMFRLTEEDATHFRCEGCNGENHKEYDKAPLEINHALHPKHPLQLVLLQHNSSTRKCYCCDEDLNKLFYYCLACDIAINLACVDKPTVLSIENPKNHEHTLTLFPRYISLTCDSCALTDSNCPFYICSPCGFAVHQNCISLPRVIKMSRHHHRISLTPSLGQGDWSCGVCRKKMDNDYGGYSCRKDGCWYAAHSKCATRNDVWDGIEIEGIPEEVDEENEEDESSEMTSGSSHQHRFRRYEDTGRDYDENKMCQACIMPIYFGNFYSCVGCDFIFHEECLGFPPEINYPLHPHLLTLEIGYNGVLSDENKCSACPWLCTAGFFYKCSRELCRFKLHVQCATISESLDHGSHEHPLELTSKPGEQRACHVCQESGNYSTNGTFNCNENCDFALCLKCATLPQKVRYTDDKHVLTLSYGEKTSTKTHWCEECERKIDQSVGFYMCDDNCCVALHIECLLGVDLYMMPGSSWFYYGEKVDVLLNNRHASRPICSSCKMRCPHKIILQCFGTIFCSTSCIRDSADRGDKVA